MLQLKTAGYNALGVLRSEGKVPGGWSTMEELRLKVDEGVARFFEKRFEVSGELGGVFLGNELLDRAIRTSEIEYMDRPGVPDSERLAMVQALDRQNGMMGLYARYVEILLPLIREAAELEHREVRVLELACGAGGLSLALAEEVRRLGLKVSITASDVVPAFVESGNLLAATKGLAVEFRVIDAFTMEGLGEGAFDIVVMSQSLHHFTPGQLAVIIAQSARHASTAFVGIDGYRSLLLAGGVPLIAGLQGIGAFTIDGLISARKFYSEMELDLIAEIATGKNNHQVLCSWPFSVLLVKF